MTKRPSVLLRLAAVGVVWLACPAAQAAPAGPVDPVEAILRAFDDHQVVALGEGNHGSLPSSAVRMQLIRDPRFRERVRDIVVEFGNSLHQEVIDRFVRGEDVATDELKKVWQDTAQANPVWELPVYEEFYRAVRDVNARLPDDKKLRLIAGDVPFDWSRVKTLEDYRKQPQRDDATSAAVIRREVLDKGRKALVLFGDVHLLRRPLVLEPRDATGDHRHELSRDRSIVEHLEADGVSVFSVFANTALDVSTLQPSAAQWDQPKIALLSGTPLGEASFAMFRPSPIMVEGTWFVIDKLHAPTMEEEFDGMLFLGAPATIRYSAPPAQLCRDQAYLDMRFFRMNLVGWGAEVEQIKQFCAAATVPSARE